MSIIGTRLIDALPPGPAEIIGQYIPVIVIAALIVVAVVAAVIIKRRKK